MNGTDTTGLQRLRGSRRVGWRTILGLLLVPLTAAGVLLWGLWNPTDRLDTMTAAVVNLDEPVTVDGQTVPLGRVLAAELIGGGDTDDGDGGDAADTNFTWLLTDASDAEAGLDDGRYATVVTIPENFSSAATSMSRAVDGSEEVETATIDIATSDRGRLLDSALSNIVTTTATSVLNRQLGAQFVGGVFVGMTELGDGIGEAASGADQLAGGAAQLADGTQQLASGTGQLASGASELASGTSGLASGAADLAAGVNQLANGDGAGNPGLAGLAAGVTSYTGGVNEALSGLQYGAGQAVAPLSQLRDAVAAGLVPVDDPDAAVAQLDTLIAQLQGASSGDPSSPIEQLKASGSALASGARDAASGAQRLAAGANTLAGGASELASGASGLASGAAELSQGAPALAEGARKSADGAAELASGLSDAVEQIPSPTQAQSDRLGEAAVQPVEASGADDELFNASGVPLFAGIALWAGAFASFLVLAPLWRRTREAARGVGFISLRSALPALVIGAAQGAVVGLILPPLLGYDLAKGAGFFCLAVLAGVAFSLVNQGLSALFGGLGRFVAFSLLVVAFAIGVISTAPPLLQAIGDASPIGALFEGFQAVAMGTNGFGSAVLSLVLWGLGGLALTAFAVARSRRREIG